ncbi:MAG: acetate--CoA ligase [Flavobacteriales bacterium]
MDSISSYHEQYQLAKEQPEQFWNKIAQHYSWRKPWQQTLQWEFETPDVKWFVNGKLNITENCLDRHIDQRGDQTCILWEPNNPSEHAKKFTYREVLAEVCRMANTLKSLGVKKGDRVCIYLPMIPELAFAVLACARIGAVHSVVFAGFSANSIADRIADSDCRFVITADGQNRGAKAMDLKPIVDEALLNCKNVEKVLVISNTGAAIDMIAPRDVWYHELYPAMAQFCEPVEMDSEDMLFILYTSGSTGKPKGVVHTCGGYMVYAGYSFANVFQYRANEIFWCTADIGWVTGHSYIVYGPLLNGATTLMFEGIPTFPDAGRCWEICERHGVNIFYTAPTAIRSLMSFGSEIPSKFKLNSLRILGSVGEPINEEAWEWYYNFVGKKRCPIADTWWQTETGGIMISSFAGVTESIPAHAGRPLPGVIPCLLDASGNVIESQSAEGHLCIQFPWPSIIRTTFGDHERCRTNYFATYKNLYFTGDGARRDENGIYRLLGRVDDVINVSGHRLGTAEIENAINEDPHVIESAVVGYPHDIKGQGICAYIITEPSQSSEQLIIQSVEETVSRVIGKIARPDKIFVVDGLPKTRSGKIMRRILRKIAEGETAQLGDTTTLLDPGVVERIITKYQARQ